jgi:hypothetical protein
MSTFSFNLDCPPNILKEKDVLSVFKNRPEKAEQIEQGMSPTEISEIVSDKVIAVVREQFQNTKNQFQGREK